MTFDNAIKTCYCKAPIPQKKDTPLISYCGFEPLMLLRNVLYIIFFCIKCKFGISLTVFI